jgi:hypothetical protein
LEYTNWHSRALILLSRDRLDVKRFLLWAEEQKTEVTADMFHEGARLAGIPDIEKINNSIFEAIVNIVDYDLYDISRMCDSNGAEFWRKLRAKWQGTSKQVIAMCGEKVLVPNKTRKHTCTLEGPAFVAKGREGCQSR